MSFTKAKEYLTKYNLEDRIIEYNVSSATVKDASIAINCKEEEIAKTLSFLVNEKPILIVTSGTQKIDNAKFKEYFQTKAKMINPENVEELIGHSIGGVCPFGINEGIVVYLDQSLKAFENVYAACGSSNSVVKLSIEELEKTSNYTSWIDVCKLREE